jgi:hypothetical protein
MFFEARSAADAAKHLAGSFTTGSTLPYDGTAIIAQSIASYTPVILVTLNYRVGIWGWTGGSEGAANGASMLGLQDQLLALKWVNQHIQSFGGDPEKVTLMGESAGAISIGLHLINPELVAAQNASLGSNSSTSMNTTITTNNSTSGVSSNSTSGNLTSYPPVSVDTPLFRGAILQSGSPQSYPLSASNSTRQAFYEAIVNLTGCTNSTEGSFECLRQVNQTLLENAQNTLLAQNPYS